MFYLFSLNLLSFEKEYCIFDVELLYGALHIYAGVDIVTDISSILINEFFKIYSYFFYY